MLDSFLDELVNQGGCKVALVKTAKKVSPADIRAMYLRLGIGGAASGAVAHKAQKTKAEMDNKPLWMHPQGSTTGAAKRVGLSGLGIAGVLHALARRKVK
jgi:hypothetical protein